MLAGGRVSVAAATHVCSVCPQEWDSNPRRDSKGMQRLSMGMGMGIGMGCRPEMDMPHEPSGVLKDDTVHRPMPVHVLLAQPMLWTTEPRPAGWHAA